MKRYWVPAIATLMVLLALMRMPYGYYTLLRLGLCAVCVYYISQFRPPLTPGHRVALGALAVLYNPIIPVHLGSKGLWTFVNTATILYFWFVEREGARCSESGQ